MSRDGKKTGGGSRKGKVNRSTAEIKAILSAEVDFVALVRRLVVMSKRRDQTAFSASRLLLEYQYGKPKETLDLDYSVAEVAALRQIAAVAMREMI
jgi:hypothetical protein